ncbi:MAG: GatB/YqeY domain-containing protein [Nitrospirae bacterium]|nr:GatB/YqeY domain-containing protein [Nitrospirota bacterium]
MNTISHSLDAALKEALKARDELRLSVIRMIKASLKNKEIEKMGTLADDDVTSVLSTMAKQRRESIEQFTSAGRNDLAEKEKKELEVIQSYLPAHLPTLIW